MDGQRTENKKFFQDKDVLTTPVPHVIVQSQKASLYMKKFLPFVFAKRYTTFTWFSISDVEGGHVIDVPADATR